MNDLQYLAFYKPYGVLTAFTDEEGRGTLKSFVPVADVYPAGRLDMDSEGLLLLTNDGELAHRLTDPRFNHTKTYLVQVEGIPTAEAIGKLEGGVLVKGQMTRRCQIVVVPEPVLPPRSKPVTPHGPTAWLRITLREGKKRQIRHMTAAVGLPTLRIVRVAIGSVTLQELQPGEWRYLTPAEVVELKKIVRAPAAKALPAAREARQKAVPPSTRQAGRPDPKAGGKPGAYRGSTPESRYRSGGRRPPGR